MESKFNEVLKDLQELNAEKISSYIILVREDTPMNEHSSKGINAIYGNIKELSNLLSNLDPEIMQKFLILQTLRGINNDK